VPLMTRAVARSSWILLAVLGLFAGCGKGPASQEQGRLLRVLCGSSMSAPIQELGQQFAASNNARIEY